MTIFGAKKELRRVSSVGSHVLNLEVAAVGGLHAFHVWPRLRDPLLRRFVSIGCDQVSLV